MGIQISGINDTISATDGSLSLPGADLTNLSQLTVTGVGTITQLRGTNLNISGVGTFATLVVSGNASIGGTVTYMDVTNVDSVGIITAQQGLQVLANGINVTGIATIAAGSVSAPSISPTGDSNTGIYFPAADHIAIVEGGTEALRIDSSGNINLDNGSVFVDAVNNRLAVGTTSPGVLFHVKQNDAVGPSIQLENNAQSVYINNWGSTGGGGNRTNRFEVNATATGYAAAICAASQIELHVGGINNEKARIDSSGRLLVGITSANANGGVLQLSSGITFPSSQVASTNPNTLDDYEEGTWTPVINRTASSPTVTYTSREGTYTKIGKFCVVFWDITISSISGGSGVATISALPFTVSSNMAGYSVILNRDNSAMTAGPAGTQLKGYFERGETHMRFQYDNSGINGFSTDSTGANWTTGRSTGCGFYEV